MIYTRTRDSKWYPTKYPLGMAESVSWSNKEGKKKTRSLSDTRSSPLETLREIPDEDPIETEALIRESRISRGEHRQDKMAWDEESGAGRGIHDRVWLVTYRVGVLSALAFIFILLIIGVYELARIRTDLDIGYNRTTTIPTSDLLLE